MAIYIYNGKYYRMEYNKCMYASQTQGKYTLSMRKVKEVIRSYDQRKEYTRGRMSLVSRLRSEYTKL